MCSILPSRVLRRPSRDHQASQLHRSAKGYDVCSRLTAQLENSSQTPKNAFPCYNNATEYHSPPFLQNHLTTRKLGSLRQHSVLEDSGGLSLSTTTMIACQLITTPRYSVFGSSMVAKSVRKESSAAATGSTDGADVFDIPRMRLRELNTANSSRYDIDDIDDTKYSTMLSRLLLCWLLAY